LRHNHMVDGAGADRQHGLFLSQAWRYRRPAMGLPDQGNRRSANVMNGFSIRQSSTNRPNILLIVMDATRANNLSCYGYHRPTTPYLDRFAERGVVYETAISPAGWSLPAHASIFTGLYPSHHGAHDEHKYLLA